MWKKRIIALVILLAAIGIGYFVYWSQITGKQPFRLGLDLSGGTDLLYNIDVSKLQPDQISGVVGSLPKFIENRISQKETAGALGVLESNISTETTSLAGGGKQYHIDIELPGVTDVTKAEDVIGKAPYLQFETENPDYKPGGGSNAPIKINASDLKNGTIDLSAALSGLSPYVPTDLTGQYLSSAALQFDQTTHAPIVALNFNAQGAALFGQITKANVGKTIGIFLDGQLIEAPRVDQAITGGQAIITGSFNPAQAKAVVDNLNHGALPVPITPISTNVIGPTLGMNAIHSGILAGIIGLLAIALLLIVWYRLPGVIATVTLMGYGAIMLALFKLIPVTITSAGIAGFIISLGMAVDANILIFERMKEEMKSGKSIHESITHGFARAWTSIRDGNISSIISAVVLFGFGGTNLIKGFALTFGLGIVASMVIAYAVSRVALLAVAGTSIGRIKRFLFSSGFSK